MKFYKIPCAWLFFWICLLPAAEAPGEGIYMYIDEEGVYHFSDTPRSAEYMPFYAMPGSVADRAAVRYEPLICDSAERYGVRPELVAAVIRAESGFDPGAVSRRGARGLMQLMPAHIREHEIEDPFDPRQNINAGTRYLGRLLRRYNGDLSLSLAAYNAGPAVVDRYRGIPPYTETRAYVKKVLSYYRRYRTLGK